MRGEQRPPPAGHDRPPRRRDLPDERPADGPEHARDRRATEICRACATGTTRSTSVSSPSSGASIRMTDPALGSAHPRDADLSLRGAGLDRAPVDLGDQPGGLHARPRRGSGASWRARSCSWWSQDIFVTETAASRRRGAAGRRLGREDWAASPASTGRSTSPRRPSSRPGTLARTSTSALDYAARMGFRDRDGGPADHLARRRVGLRGLEGLLARTPLRLLRRHATSACAAAAASSGRAPTRPRTAPSACTPTASSTPTPTTPRPTATTCSPGRRTPRSSYRAKRPDGRAFLQSAAWTAAARVDAGRLLPCC